MALLNKLTLFLYLIPFGNISQEHYFCLSWLSRKLLELNLTPLLDLHTNLSALCEKDQ